MRKLKAGADYYAAKGQRPITVYVSEPVHKALLEESKETELSLQKVVRRILEKHTTKI